MSTTHADTDTVTDASRGTRKSLPLTARDMADLKKLLSSNEHKAALRGLADLRSTSESQVLHALMVIGMRVVEAKVEEDGYAALAYDPDYQAYAEETRAINRRPLRALEPTE